MFGNVKPFLLLIFFNANSVKLKDVGFFTRCSSKDKPVLDGGKTFSLSFFGDLFGLDPSFTVATELSGIVLQLV